ncbi:TPA: hypothetical protein JG847_004915 [Vibrio parahaemolyticus]|nr:hypothetical protein [Vibrio parahaemolyticus]
MIKTELFNTHQFVKDLKAAGMDEKQAEVLADHQLAMLETHIATKADISNLENRTIELTGKVNTVESRVQVTERLMWGVLLGVIALVIKAYFVV